MRRFAVRNRARLLAACVTVVVVWTAVACNDRVSGPRLPALTAVVTGAAAAALQPNGEFTLASAPAGLVTESQARALSVAYVRTFGYGLDPTWEFERLGGAPIDYTQLMVCARTFYARSPYEPLPSTASFVLRQRYGSYWLTSFCGAGGDPEVSVAVPAVDTQFHVDSVGNLTGMTGNDSSHFISTGVGPGVVLPPSPETMVQDAAQWTQRRVTQVPELVLSSPRFLPQLARWRLVLESPVNMINIVDRSRLTLSQVYDGYGDVVLIRGLQVGLLCGPAQDTVFDPETGTDTTTLSVAPGYANCYYRIDTVGQRFATPAGK
jgi:hypothetical protein